MGRLTALAILLLAAFGASSAATDPVNIGPIRCRYVRGKLAGFRSARQSSIVWRA